MAGSRLFGAALLTVAMLLPASGAERIGAATEAKNDVTGTLDELERSINAGDGVSANEILKTGTGSVAVITFLDDTSLNVGASSTIVLDRFVYNPEGSADDAVLNLTKGAFRFVTGKSDPSKFVIRTQVATLGIRGTDFVVICDGINRCGVVVAKGLVKVCPRPDRPVDCDVAFQLDQKKNAAIIGPDGETSGAKSVSRSLVQGIIAAVAAGKDVSPTLIATGFNQVRPPVRTSPPRNGTPG